MNVFVQGSVVTVPKGTWHWDIGDEGSYTHNEMSIVLLAKVRVRDYPVWDAFVVLMPDGAIHNLDSPSSISWTSWTHVE